MRKRRPVYGFKQFKQHVLLEIAWKVLHSMKGNTNFRNPDITMVVFARHVKNYQKKLEAARSGGRKETAELKKARKILFII